eukprot:gene22621-29764_t
MAPKSLLIVGGGTAGAFCAKEAKASGLDLGVTIVDRKDFFDIQFANVRYAVKPDLDFFDIQFANVRYAVKPDLVPGIHVPFTDIPGIGTFKKGTVTAMTKSTATLDSGEELKFDYLVICTGSTNGSGAWAQAQGTTIAELICAGSTNGSGSWAQAQGTKIAEREAEVKRCEHALVAQTATVHGLAQGTTIAEREAEVKATSAQIASAKNIVVVGGGPATSAQIASAKNIVVVGGGPPGVEIADEIAE